MLLALGLLAYALVAQGDRIADALGDIGLGHSLASLVAVLVGLGASAMVWRSLLADLGDALSLRATMHVFFLGQLGKYVPGSVFAVAAQMEIGKQHGVSRSRVGTASLVFMGVLVAAGLLVAAVALPLTSPDALRQFFWVLLVLPVGLVCLAPPVLTRLVATGLRVLRRDPLERPLTWRGTGAAIGWALAMWVAYGVHALVLIAPQASGTDARLPLLALGGYALSWTAGFLFVIAPAGAGVREAALVAALAPVLDAPAAIAVAVLSRALMTVGDLVWAGAGVLSRPRGVAGVASVTGLQATASPADS